MSNTLWSVPKHSYNSVLLSFISVLLSNIHRWASISISMPAISDIRHRHLLFQYRKKICGTENCHSDIGRVPISTSESIPIFEKYLAHPQDSNQVPYFHRQASYFSVTMPTFKCLDVGHWIWDKSLF